MLSKVHLQNFAAFSDFRWSGLGGVNVIVGENDTGKSHLLKAMYVLVKCAEAEKKPGAEKEWKARCFEKLRWTFQPRNGLEALLKHENRKFTIGATILGADCSFFLGTAPGIRSTPSKPEVLIGGKIFPKPKGSLNGIFVPPKEILTTFSAIAATREALEIFGFDDTYYDLIKLLRVPATQSKLDPNFSKVLEELFELFEGRIVKAQSSDEFTFERGKRAYGMPQTADGIKKIGILATLIENRSLNPTSILFLDEPETNLHPKAISYLTRLLFEIGRAGAQVFLATHNYLVIKQLQILAKKHGESVPFCSLVRRGDTVLGEINDLRDGMPDNPIIDESIRLYREELEVDLGNDKRG